MGAIYMCHAFGPAMVDRGRGHVVNISSGLGYTPTATEPGYGTTKAAVLAFSRSLRADWHSQGVGVSAICPGVINTPIISHTRFRGEQAAPDRIARVKDVFAKRGHAPELVARAVLAAVRQDKSVVPVGVESHAGWYISRWAPTRFTDWMARVAARRI
jgi:short-subunit dehydrogenase